MTDTEKELDALRKDFKTFCKILLQYTDRKEEAGDWKNNEVFRENVMRWRNKL